MKREIKVKQINIPGLKTALHLEGVGHPSGGDFFNVVTKNGKRIFFLGDFSGHGEQVSVSAKEHAKIVLDELKKKQGIETAFKKANNRIEKNGTDGSFSTITAGIYDPKKNALDKIYAGGQPLIHFYVDEKEGTFVAKINNPAKGKMPLGMFDNVEYAKEEPISIKKGVYLAHSDGIEYKTPDGSRLDQKNFANMVVNLLNARKNYYYDGKGNFKNLKRFVRDIRKKLEESGERKDDLTLFAFSKKR